MKNADTTSDPARMNVIRLMMQDFYQQNNQQMKDEVFCKIITDTIEKLGRKNNE